MASSSSSENKKPQEFFLPELLEGVAKYVGNDPNSIDVTLMSKEYAEAYWGTRISLDMQEISRPFTKDDDPTHNFEVSRFWQYKFDRNDIRKILSHARNLKSLTMPVDVQDSDMISMIYISETLRQLYLNNCLNLSDRALDNVLECKNLTSLSFRGCSFLTDGSLMRLVHLSSLNSLDIRRCDSLTYYGLKFIPITVKSLLLSGNLTEDFVLRPAFTEFLNNHVTSLVLEFGPGQVPFRNEGTLTERDELYLKKKNSLLEKAERGDDSGGSSSSSSGEKRKKKSKRAMESPQTSPIKSGKKLELLPSTLSRMTNLRKLSLNFPKDNIVQPLAIENIKYLTNLQELKFRWCSLLEGRELEEAIETATKAIGGLDNLSIEFCTDISKNFLANAIKSSTNRLKTLSLKKTTFNVVNTSEASDFCNESIVPLTALRKLNLYGTILGLSDVLEDSISKMTWLKELVISPQSLVPLGHSKLYEKLGGRRNFLNPNKIFIDLFQPTNRDSDTEGDDDEISAIY